MLLLLVCKVFGLKIRMCKFFNKSQVCECHVTSTTMTELEKIKTHLPGNLSLRNIAPSNNPAAKSSFIGFNLSGNPTIWRENHLQSRQDMILQMKMSSSKKSTHSSYHQCPISHLSRSSVHHLLWMADWILAQPSTFSITDHK